MPKDACREQNATILLPLAMTASLRAHRSGGRRGLECDWHAIVNDEILDSSPLPDQPALSTYCRKPRFNCAVVVTAGQMSTKA